MSYIWGLVALGLVILGLSGAFSKTKCPACKITLQGKPTICPNCRTPLAWRN